jgi:hypothetical protein
VAEPAGAGAADADAPARGRAARPAARSGAAGACGGRAASAHALDHARAARAAADAVNARVRTRLYLYRLHITAHWLARVSIDPLCPSSFIAGHSRPSCVHERPETMSTRSPRQCDAAWVGYSIVRPCWAVLRYSMPVKDLCLYVKRIDRAVCQTETHGCRWLTHAPASGSSPYIGGATAHASTF